MYIDTNCLNKKIMPNNINIVQLCSNCSKKSRFVKHHITALLSNGMVLMFGFQRTESLNIISSTIPLLLTQNSNIDSIYAGQEYILLLMKNNDLYEINLNKQLLSPVFVMDNIKMLTSGTKHVVIYCNNGNIYGYKSNSDNQLCKLKTRYFDVPKLLKIGLIVEQSKKN